MNAMRRRLAKLATLLGAVALLWACNAPFIPVPPPGRVLHASWWTTARADRRRSG